jgi:RNA polymerase sigma-70 factor (ECF subfamily)
MASGSLPGDTEALLRLTLPDSAGLRGGGMRGPVEEQTLTLFDELRKPLLRYLLSLRVAPERGEEILQDTFLKLFEHLKSGRQDDNIRGWLFRVAHNLALRELRGRRYEGVAEASVCDRPPAPVPDPCPDPEQQVILDERETRLLAALQKLPELEQRCLHLRAEGLRYREISDVLHIGVTTVADCLRRAIDTIRKELHG